MIVGLRASYGSSPCWAFTYQLANRRRYSNRARPGSPRHPRDVRYWRNFRYVIPDSIFVPMLLTRSPLTGRNKPLPIDFDLHVGMPPAFNHEPGSNNSSNLFKAQLKLYGFVLMLNHLLASLSSTDSSRKSSTHYRLSHLMATLPPLLTLIGGAFVKDPRQSQTLSRPRAGTEAAYTAASTCRSRSPPRCRTRVRTAINALSFGGVRAFCIVSLTMTYFHGRTTLSRRSFVSRFLFGMKGWSRNAGRQA